MIIGLPSPKGQGKSDDMPQLPNRVQAVWETPERLATVPLPPVQKDFHRRTRKTA
jgi:hypothetical protein